MKLPRHICMSLSHNPHAGNYETVEKWLEHRDLEGSVDIDPADRAEMLRTGEIWQLSWCPDTPVGSCAVAAATLERVLELVDEPEQQCGDCGEVILGAHGHCPGVPGGFGDDDG